MDGGALPLILVGEVICLVTSFHERDLSLLNHVKYDSYVIASQRDSSRTHQSHYSYSFFQTCQFPTT